PEPPPTTPAPPTTNPGSPADEGTSSTGHGASSEGAAAGTPGEPRDGSRTDSPVIGDSPPADAPSGGAHKSATTAVSMEDFFFSPASVTVHVGDLVTWHNTGKEPHTATADDGSFDTGTVTAGGSASHMFTQAGTFTY